MKAHKRFGLCWLAALVVGGFATSAAGQHTYTEDFKTIDHKKQMSGLTWAAIQ